MCGAWLGEASASSSASPSSQFQHKESISQGHFPLEDYRQPPPLSNLIFPLLPCECFSRDERLCCSPTAGCGTSQRQTSLWIPTWYVWHAKQQRQWGLQRNHGRDIISAACRDLICSPQYHLTRYRPAAGIPTFLGIPKLYPSHNLSFISWAIPWTGCSLGHTGACITARWQKRVPDSLGNSAWCLANTHAWNPDSTSIKIFSFYIWKHQSFELSDHRRLCFLTMFIILFLWAGEERGRKDDLCLGFLSRCHTANATKAMCSVGKESF